MDQAVREGSEQTEPAVIAFAPPYEKNGVTVITATSTGRPIRGSGRDPGTLPGAHPMGAFVITGGGARWQPAVDVTRLLTTAEVAPVWARVLSAVPLQALVNLDRKN